MGYLDNVLNYSPIADYRTIYSFEAPTIPVKIDINDIEQISKLKLSRYFEIKNNKPIEVYLYQRGSLQDQKLKRYITIRKLKEAYNILLKRCLKAEDYINSNDWTGKENKLELAIKKFHELADELHFMYEKLILEGVLKEGQEKLREVAINEF